MYRVEILPSAARALRGLSRADQHRLVAAVGRLISDPRPPGCRKLRGADDVWRLCVGDYRVLYRVDDALLHVLVIAIGHRRDVYR